VKQVKKLHMNFFIPHEEPMQYFRTPKVFQNLETANKSANS